MKLMYYIRGFGAGLIVTAIVLMIAGKVTENNAEIKQQETTSSGSVIAYSKDDKTENESQTKQEETSSVESTEDVTEKTTEKPTEAKTEAPTEKPTEAKTEAPTQKATEAPTKKADDNSGTLTVQFYGASDGYKAADILYDAGVISDKDDFFMALLNSGLSTAMHDGTYTISKNASYEEIIRIITGY